MKKKWFYLFMVLFLPLLHCCENDPIKNEPYHKNITALACDGSGDIWVGSRNNLLKITPGK